jgi:hypothetical protein
VRLRRELEDRDEEERERRRGEERHLDDGELAAGELAAGRPGIARIDADVDEAVQRHRERASADHRQRDPEEIVRGGRPADGKERPDVGEGKREDGVLDLHEPREPRRQRRKRRSRSRHERHAMPWPLQPRPTCNDCVTTF